LGEVKCNPHPQPLSLKARGEIQLQRAIMAPQISADKIIQQVGSEWVTFWKDIL